MCKHIYNIHIYINTHRNICIVYVYIYIYTLFIYIYMRYSLELPRDEPSEAGTGGYHLHALLSASDPCAEVNR